MTEASPPALDRIERALTRIESAARRRAFDAEALERRHAALREKVEGAIAALDSLIERQGD
jgi:transposase